MHRILHFFMSPNDYLSGSLSPLWGVQRDSIPLAGRGAEPRNLPRLPHFLRPLRFQAHLADDHLVVMALPRHEGGMVAALDDAAV